MKTISVVIASFLILTSAIAQGDKKQEQVSIKKYQRMDKAGTTISIIGASALTGGIVLFGLDFSGIGNEQGVNDAPSITSFGPAFIGVGVGAVLVGSVLGKIAENKMNQLNNKVSLYYLPQNNNIGHQVALCYRF